MRNIKYKVEKAKLQDLEFLKFGMRKKPSVLWNLVYKRNIESAASITAIQITNPRKVVSIPAVSWQPGLISWSF